MRYSCFHYHITTILKEDLSSFGQRMEKEIDHFEGCETNGRKDEMVEACNKLKIRHVLPFFKEKTEI